MQPPPGKPPPSPPIFFTDRDLGRYDIPNAIRGHGFQVHTMYSVYGAGQEMNVEDVSWIREGAQKGWILLSGNKNMRYVPLELKAIQESQARVFVLAQGD